MDKLKKLTKVVLNQQGKVLPKEQMMKILGGGSAYCHCWNSSGAFDASSCSRVSSLNAMVLEEYKTAIP